MAGCVGAEAQWGRWVSLCGLLCLLVHGSGGAASCAPVGAVDAVHRSEVKDETTTVGDAGEVLAREQPGGRERPSLDALPDQPNDAPASKPDTQTFEQRVELNREYSSENAQEVTHEKRSDRFDLGDIQSVEPGSQDVAEEPGADVSRPDADLELVADMPGLPEPTPERVTPEPPSPPSTGFAATHASWSVPASGTIKGFFAVAAGSRGEYWALVDMDGDGKPDLVQTADPKTQKIWGGSRGHWRVYRNTGSSFSSAATQWSVPSSGTSRGFYTVASAASGGYWSLVDINGDKKPDLVQTADPKTQKIWGGSRGYWQVFLNSGRGFGTSAVRWPLPLSGTNKGFYLTAAAANGQYWALIDMDGDKKPDLVQTADPATQKVWGGSRGYWKRYTNTGSGFSLSANHWSVPASGTSKGFYLVANASATEVWSLLDLDGDGRPELVQTADPKTRKVWGGSRGYWLRFANTGRGFAGAGTKWTVPVSGTSRGFYAPGAATSGQYWALIDLDGDKKPELMQTADPATQKIWGGSRGYWKRYANTGSGFATTHASWSVPVSGTSKGFYIPGSGSGREVWSLLDLNGDKKPELVQTADPSTQKIWGGSRGFWRVFAP